MVSFNTSSPICKMIWIFALIFFAIWAYIAVELYLYFRPAKNTGNWHDMSEWQWRRRVRKAIDDLLNDTNSAN